MNPYFIFNCVNGIQYYVLANKTDEVLVYLSYFSKVVRESLANATLRLIPLEQEIDFLHSYLKQEQMRFPDKFDYDIRSFKGEEIGFVQLPPMLVQPFAENAIRHGFMNLKKKGRLSLFFEKAGEDVLKCTIADNGIGRNKARLQKGQPQDDDRPHSGTITETRIRLFNTTSSPDKYKIVYTDLSKNGKPCGLQVELYLPMEIG
ncbi:MAG: histidine kinase [Bacteroidota bacterium]|nr:histidine kinase [Bacteroidota bacterium]